VYSNYLQWLIRASNSVVMLQNTDFASLFFLTLLLYVRGAGSPNCFQVWLLPFWVDTTSTLLLVLAKYRAPLTQQGTFALLYLGLQISFCVSGRVRGLYAEQGGRCYICFQFHGEHITFFSSEDRALIGCSTFDFQIVVICHVAIY
jgi:hypothetical protein